MLNHCQMKSQSWNWYQFCTLQTNPCFRLMLPSGVFTSCCHGDAAYRWHHQCFCLHVGCYWTSFSFVLCKSFELVVLFSQLSLWSKNYGCFSNFGPQFRARDGKTSAGQISWTQWPTHGCAKSMNLDKLVSEVYLLGQHSALYCLFVCLKVASPIAT